MTSNSRANFPLRTVSQASALATALVTASGAWGSDAPAPGAPAPRQSPAARAAPASPLQRNAADTVSAQAAPRRLKIASVSIQGVAPAEAAARATLNAADKPVSSPVVISVQVAEPFANLERSASPVIVVNGQTITDSFVPHQERNRVVAFVPDGTLLDQSVSVQVGWLGDMERTLSEPVQAQVAR